MSSPRLKLDPNDSLSSDPVVNVHSATASSDFGYHSFNTEGNGLSSQIKTSDESDSGCFQKRHDGQEIPAPYYYSIRKRYTRLACWIHNIPPEILIQIFLRCLDTNRRSPPWYLSHVCRIWREIALRTPQLWRRVPLPTLSNHVERARALVAFLPEYLARSKDQDIVFNWEGNWDPQSLEEEDEFEDPICGQSDVILDLLIQNAERWGRVSVTSGRWTPKFAYQLVQLQERLSQLYHLELGSNDLQVMYVESFRSAPRLREVKLCTPIDASDPDLIQSFVDWSQLRQLKLTIPSSTVLTHLNLCQHLVELDLEYAGSDMTAFGPEMVELPNLKALSLRSPSDLSSAHFDLLSLRSLEDFRVFSILAEPDPFTSFLRFLDRHSKSLQRLIIGHIHFMYFRTSIPETRIDFTSLPFGILQRLVYLQLHHPPLDKLSVFLKTIGRGVIPLHFQCLHIVFNDATKLSDSYIKEVADHLRAVVFWAESSTTFGSQSPIRRIIVNPGELNDCWEFLSALEGWPEEFTVDLAQPFTTLCRCERALQMIHPFEYINKETVLVAKFDAQDTQTIGNCLTSMDLDVHQVHLLYCTRLQFIVHALSKLTPDQLIPMSDDIPERASILAARWKTLFEEDSPNRRWMHRGSHQLVYVPLNDELYRPIIEYWMYGLKPEWEIEEVGDLL